jgi:hypothetical protein
MSPAFADFPAEVDGCPRLNRHEHGKSTVREVRDCPRTE